MIVTCKIFTTSKTAWFEKDFPFIKSNLMKAKGVTEVEFNIEHIILEQMPIFQGDGWTLFTWEWFRETFTKKALPYTAVCLHLTRADMRRFGIKGIAGAYVQDVENDVFEFFVGADKGQRAEFYPEMSEFARVFIHELGGHGFEHFTYGTHTGYTHAFDYGPGGEKDRSRYLLPELTSIMDFTEYDKKMEAKLRAGNRLIQLYYQLIDALKARMNKPMLPIDAKFFSIDHVTQQFGVSNSRYKSGIHNGIDLACPIGTQLIAPADGAITWRCDDHPTLGGAVYYSCIINEKRYYMRFLHLSHAAKVGHYRKGEIIGLTGNSGDSTGAHLHHDVWTRPIDTTKIRTPDNVRKYMVDPLMFWKEVSDEL